MHVAAPYRSSGADLPFGSLTSRHGVAMEGYFWRFTDPDAQSVVTALIGVQQSSRGPWALVGLGAHPGRFWRGHSDGRTGQVGRSWRPGGVAVLRRRSAHRGRLGARRPAGRHSLRPEEVAADAPVRRIELVPDDPGTEPVLAPVAVGRTSRRHSHDRR